jgi:cellobiose phosphorylase
MYPGIPEYFNNRGRGMYPYLTGSASWYLLTLVTRVFGVFGKLGDLALAPKLVSAQFDSNGEAGIATLFCGRMLEVIYKNPAGLEYGSYRIGAITIDGNGIPGIDRSATTLVPRATIDKLDDSCPHQLVIQLVKV